MSQGRAVTCATQGRPPWLRLAPGVRAARRFGVLLALLALVSALTTGAAWASTPGLATLPASSAAPLPGGYGGSDSQGVGLSFYVSANRKQVQDISINQVGLSCSNGSTELDDNFGIATETIKTGTTFTGTSTQKGEVGGKPATITDTFAGQFGSTAVTGQLSEVITYKAGTTVTCASPNLSWTATLSAQGSQTAAPPLPGSYGGGDSQGVGLSFDVSANRKQVQDVLVNQVGLSCSNGSSELDDNFGLAAIPITSGTSFTGTVTQKGEVGGKPATITYLLKGHFHGLSTSGDQRVAGQLRETITYPTGTTVTCTSDSLNWTATLSAQGSQTAAPPLPGSYGGGDSQGVGLSFDVSADSSQIQDVSVNQVGLSCSNGSSELDDNFGLAAIPITSGTNFTGTSTQNGEVGGKSATITYTFTGHFHGLNTSGDQRVSGQLNEVITYPSGTTVTCTSNSLNWSATS